MTSASAKLSMISILIFALCIITGRSDPFSMDKRTVDCIYTCDQCSQRCGAMGSMGFSCATTIPWNIENHCTCSNVMQIPICPTNDSSRLRINSVSMFIPVTIFAICNWFSFQQ